MADLAGECFEQVSGHLQAACDLIARCWGAKSWPVRRPPIASAIARQKGSVASAMAGLKALRSPSRSLSKQRISNSPDGREN
jgi:hypothetical protein